MQYLLLGLGVLVLFLALARAFVKANPQRLASNLRKIGGSTAIFAAVIFALLGRFPVAIPLALFGLALLGRGFSFGFPGKAKKSAGQSSKVKTEFLEMALDHDSGEMRGYVLKGQFQGRALSSLSQNDLFSLLRECQAQDAQSAQLVLAYLDAAYPHWRDSTQDGGARENANEGNRYRSRGKMTVEEAYEILGLQPGAGPEDIHKAHRSLMKKFHPDQGGSTYLASKINEAKDVLLNR